MWPQLVARIEHPGTKVTGFAEHALDEMEKGGRSLEMVDNIVRDGKAVFEPWSGGRYLFVTEDGAALTDMGGKVITAWPKTDFRQPFLSVYWRLGFE
jgi:hypothetical protein